MQSIWDVVVAAAIGAMGGLANYCFALQAGRTFSWLVFLTSFFTSGFVGVLLYWLCAGLHLDPSLCSFGAGIGGLLGTRAVDIIEASIRKQLGVSNDNPRNPEL